MAMTTNPMVNLSTLKMHPDRPTNVTMPKLKMAIQMIDIVKEARKYLRLCGLLQSGMVHVNIQMKGKLTTNNNHPSEYLNGAKMPPSSGYSGNSADTAGRHGQSFIFASSSLSIRTSFLGSTTDFVSESSSIGTVRAFPLASTWTTESVGCWLTTISERRLYSFITCFCATDLSLIFSPGAANPAELRRCALGLS